MNFYALDVLVQVPIVLSFVSAIFVLIVGGVVFIKERTSPIHRTFFLQTISLAIWLSASSMLFASRGNDEKILFWDRIVYIGVVFIPILIYHFSLYFTEALEKQKKLLYLGYALSVFFLFASRTDYFVKDVFTYQWGVHTKAQFLHHFFLAFFFFYFFLVFRNFWLCYKYAVDKIERLKAEYILIAFFLLVALGSTAYFPAYGIGVYPFGYVAGVVFSLVIAYAILRYRLMDITIAFKKGVGYTISLALVLSVYTGGIFILRRFVFLQYIRLPEMVIDILITLCIAFGFLPLKKYFDKLFELLLVKEEAEAEDSVRIIEEEGQIVYQYRNRVQDKESALQEFRDFLKTSAEEVKKVIRSDVSGIYYYHCVEDFFYKIHDKNEPGPELYETDMLYREVLISRGVIVKDEISYLLKNNTKRQEYCKKLIEDMDRVGAEALCPLLQGRQVYGFVYVGKKRKKNKAFTTHDLEYLEKAANKVACNLISMGCYLNNVFGVERP